MNVLAYIQYGAQAGILTERHHRTADTFKSLLERWNAFQKRISEDCLDITQLQGDYDVTVEMLSKHNIDLESNYTTGGLD